MDINNIDEILYDFHILNLQRREFKEVLPYLFNFIKLLVHCLVVKTILRGSEIIVHIL